MYLFRIMIFRRKKIGVSKNTFFTCHIPIEMRKVKRNSPITHWILQKWKNWILTFVSYPKAHPFMKKTRVQKSHATVHLSHWVDTQYHTRTYDMLHLCPLWNYCTCKGWVKMLFLRLWELQLGIEDEKKLEFFFLRCCIKRGNHDPPVYATLNVPTAWLCMARESRSCRL